MNMDQNLKHAMSKNLHPFCPCLAHVPFLPGYGRYRSPKPSFGSASSATRPVTVAFTTRLGRYDRFRWENAAIIWDLLRGLSERFRQGVGPSASIYPEEAGGVFRSA